MNWGVRYKGERLVLSETQKVSMHCFGSHARGGINWLKKSISGKWSGENVWEKLHSTYRGGIFSHLLWREVSEENALCRKLKENETKETIFL